MAGAKISQESSAAAWDRAHFSSCSSHSSPGPCLGSASPCSCSCTAEMGVFVGIVVIDSLLFLQQPGWRCQITPKITQPCSGCSSCSGLGKGRCENVSGSCQPGRHGESYRHSRDIKRTITHWLMAIYFLRVTLAVFCLKF